MLCTYLAVMFFTVVAMKGNVSILLHRMFPFKIKKFHIKNNDDQQWGARVCSHWFPRANC